VNFFFSGGTERTEDTLATQVHNCNGASFVNCVFNDTVVVICDDDISPEKGVSFAGCTFKPDDFFTGQGSDEGAPQWTGTAPYGDYDCFVRVDGAQNVNVAASTFMRSTSTGGEDPNPGVFAYHVIAANRANVSYSAPIVPPSADNLIGNYRFELVDNPDLVPCLTQGDGAIIVAECDDILNGRQYSFVLKSEAPAPIVRGMSDLSIADLKNGFYDAYVAIDSGRHLQTLGPELADGSGAVIHTAASIDTSYVVPVGAKYIFLDLSALPAGAFTITISEASTLHDFPFRITVVRTPLTVVTLTWSISSVTQGGTLAGSIGGATSTSLHRLSYELLYNGPTGNYYVMDQMP
jgi:hypothetical protein